MTGLPQRVSAPASSPRKKTRILFVLSQLVQHGSERYLFEICQALDKERFAVEVMTRAIFVKHHHYHAKLLALGVPVHRKLVSRRFFIYPIKRWYRSSARLRRVIGAAHRTFIKSWYGRFFDPFDVIAVIGIETYCDALSPVLDGNANVVIHHVNHQFQFERNYFDECPQRKLVIVDRQQEMEVRNSRMSDASLYMLPLPMHLSTRPHLPPPVRVPGEPVRIGVVSRLFRDRPNEPLLRCFGAVLGKTDAVLYFYGGGDKTQYDALIDELGIREKVIFMGHQEDLEGAIQRDRLSMLWLVSMGTSISYGSIEVASLGVPMVFWNLSSQSHEEILAATDGALFAFDNEERFAAFNVTLLHDLDALRTLGNSLRAYVQREFEIGHNVAALEAYYEGVASIVGPQVSSGFHGG